MKINKKLLMGLFILFVIPMFSAYTPPTYDSVDLVLTDEYVPPSYDNINLVLGDVVVGDTCTYISGDWNVLCLDFCNITSNVVGDGSNIILSGNGNFNVKANIDEFDSVIKDNSCQIIKSNSAQISII